MFILFDQPKNKVSWLSSFIFDHNVFCSFVCENLRRLSVRLKWKRFCYDFVGVGLTWIEITEIFPYTCFEIFSFSQKNCMGIF